MTGSRIEVGICLDRHMLHAAMVLLASIKHHARSERPIRVFVLTDHTGPEFHDLAASTNDARFTIQPIVCENLGEGLPVRDYLTAALYMRFQLPSLLPEIERILYLDIDIVVNRDLASLFDTDLRGLSTAAIPDWPMVLGSRTWPTFRIPYDGKRYRFDAYARDVLDLDPSRGAPYFNTGVLLMDLAVWRRDAIADRTLALLAATRGFHYPDQDALNAVLRGNHIALDARWNAQAICMRIPFSPLDWTGAGRRWTAIRRLWRDDPWIVHYAGANKPWVPDQPATPRDDLWWAYAACSPMVAAIRDAYRARETSAQRRRSKCPAPAEEPRATSAFADLPQAKK